VAPGGFVGRSLLEAILATAADLCRGGVTVPLNTPAFLWAYWRRVRPKTDAVGSDSALHTFTYVNARHRLQGRPVCTLTVTSDLPQAANERRPVG